MKETPMQATMNIIVSEGKDRSVYPGASDVIVNGSFPEYHGGPTLTIQFIPQMESTKFPGVITVDPKLRGGVPCIGIDQIPISQVLERLASGISPYQLSQELTGLSLSDIQLALDIAAWVLRDPLIDWQSLNLPSMASFQHEMNAWQNLSDESFEKE